VYDSNNHLIKKTVNQWLQTIIAGSGDNRVDFVFLSRTDQYSYEWNGNTQSNGIRIAEEFRYSENPQYGNLTLHKNLGTVDMGTGDDIGEDKRSISNYYSNNADPDVWIIGLANTVVVTNNIGDWVRNTSFVYDNQSLTTPPVKGLLTLKEESTGFSFGDPRNPRTLYSYGQYGNLKTTTDPLGRVTRIEYDLDYHIFPLKTTNALIHEVTNTYFGINGVALDDANGRRGLWGQLKSTTDLNGQTGEKVYDVLGRLVKSISPLDSLAQPTSQTEYTSFSDHVLISSHHRVKHGDNLVLSSYKIVDGLGKVIETKTPTATAGKYAINGYTEYNAQGLPIKQYLPFFSDPNKTFSDIEAPPAAVKFTKIDYDVLGRAITKTKPNGIGSLQG